MGRSILAVLAGATLWAILWLGSNAALAAIFPDHIVVDQYIGHAGILTTLLLLSVVYSVAAGYATGAVARTGRVGHGVALGVLQLGLGIFFQAQYWQLMPLWYHLPFLALLLPGNVYGAWLRETARQRVSALA
jgi:hypothetical protein